MEEHELLYELKDLQKNIVFFLTKDKCNCEIQTPPTPTQIRIIDYILNCDKKEIYQKDLEKNLNLTRATLSGVLKTMEKNNIIKRKISNNDARSKTIVLNDSFENLFIKSQKKLKEAEFILTKNINKNELTVFKNTLKKMKYNLATYNKERNDKYDKINEKL